MMADLKFNNVMIGSAQPDTLAEFYRGVFGRDADMAEGGWYTWRAGNGSLSMGEHSEVKDGAKEPQRVIMNFETPDVQAEFDRLKGMGATVVKEPYELQGVWIATFADPDGNYFQLMSQWEEAANA
jgi:predicted enzyme related to lactoylglutathione lyase